MATSSPVSRHPVFVYGDGSTYQGPWESAPGRDVQVVIFWDPTLDTWTIRHGGQANSPCDFFRQAEDGTVVGMDQAGMIDHVVHELGVVKQGRMLSKAQWDAVLRQAMALRDELRSTN